MPGARSAVPLIAVAFSLGTVLARAQPGDRGTTTGAPADPMRALLDAHNRLRGRHCAPPLRWSADLARVAQRWADTLVARGCAFEHSGGRYGENLAAGTEGALGPDDVVQMWYRESRSYRFSNGRFSMATGHFTQLVWFATRAVGCGTRTCNAMRLWVCNYDPPGNVEGEYAANVRPASCR